MSEPAMFAMFVCENGCVLPDGDPEATLFPVEKRGEVQPHCSRCGASMVDRGDVRMFTFGRPYLPD